MLTRDDVMTAYRVLQRREPESEEVITQWMENVGDIDALIEAFITSAEFRGRIGPRLKLSKFKVPESLGPIEIDVDASPEQLSRLFSSIQRQWEKLGDADPHWSVLTDEKFRTSRLPGNKRAFYETGAAEMQKVAAMLARNRIDPSSLHCAFELGCGVGRLTMHLANVFQRVIGADISRSHLASARTHMDEMNIANVVDLRQLRDFTDLERISGYDFFCSFIVFQHNPPPVIAWMLKTALLNLSPGGVAMFQIPSYYTKYRFSLTDYLARGYHSCSDNPFDGTMEAHPLPQSHVFAICRQTGCDIVEVREDDWVGDPGFAISNTYLVTKR
jgi:SAM-dependent methyltransferase